MKSVICACVTAGFLFIGVVGCGGTGDDAPRKDAPIKTNEGKSKSGKTKNIEAGLEDPNAKKK